ncbi:hypothetical protein ACFXGA_09370 [Actinosynnema sp. NPDC059335]|uniref:hypothetical protein n=1 Tax=Actinosynnema sp. NPDC059335 TaxID=3346804 RepID=UPI003671ECB1
MIKRIASALAAVVAAAGLLFVAQPTALASNGSSNGCTYLFVEYTSSGSTRYINYATASNTCGTYWGFHEIGGVTGPTQNQGSFTRYYGNVAVQAGGYICATSWRHIGGSTFERVGAPCTLIA